MNLNLSLNNAVMNGDFNVVHSLIKYGYDINERRTIDLTTPLMNSLFNDQDIISIYLIKNGANLECYDRNGFTPLMISILVCNELFANILIYCGVNINTQNIDGITPLMMAVNNGLINIVNKLLILGADVNIRNNANESALTNAIQERYGDIELLLRSYGAL